MVTKYTRDANGQEVQLRLVHEIGEDGTHITKETYVPVDTTIVEVHGKQMTLRQFHELCDRPDAMMECINTGEVITKKEWLERCRKSNPNEQI